MWIQRSLHLPSYPRGFHLITSKITATLPEINKVDCGLLHVFIQHSSASLSINENADPTVRQDFETVFNSLVPENDPRYRHNDEGSDDLPAHIKSSLLGASVTIPVGQGQLLLGTWQGIYLCEHRNYGGRRRLILTLNGE